MADLYVSTTGTDATGDGSEGNPYQHIHAAIDAITAGSVTIWCMDGTYDTEEGRDLGYAPLTIRGSSREYSKVLISPSTLYGDDSTGAWIRNGQHKLILQDLTCVLDNNNISAWSGTKYNRLAYATDGNVYGTTDLIVAVNCLFRCDCDSGSYVRAFENAVYGNISFYKCTFRGWQNGTSVWYALNANQNNARATLTAYDCIFEDCYQALRVGGASTVLNEGYNCFYSNATDSSRALAASDISGTDANPLFLTATGAEIASNSPCVNAGTTIAGYVTSYTGAAPDIGCYELPRQLLLYTGFWNNGSSSGTVNFTDRVLSIGDITESLMNGAESRGWVMQAAVTLDDNDQFWAGSFAQGNQWLNGTFTLQQQFNGTWTPMLVGYVEPADYTHDYGDRQANIQITSMLARISYEQVPYGVIERGTFDPYRPLARLMGTVSAVGTDGTVTLDPAEDDTARIPHHSFIWQGVDGTVYPDTQEQARLKGFNPETATGTTRDMTFHGGVPDWCTVGQIVYATEPWPTQSLLENEVSNWGLRAGFGSYDLAHPLAALWYDACRQMGLVFDADSLAEMGTRLSFYQMSVTAHIAAAAGYYAGYPWSNGTSPYYYGGEKWTEVLTDLFSSVGANWTVNGAGSLRAYLYQPGAQEPSGSLSFLNAYGDWTAALQEGASEVKVYSDYDPVESYQGTYSLQTGASGNAVTVNARWQRASGGQLLASRLRFKLGSTGPAFSLVMDGTQWPTYQAGQTWTITDMPAELLPVTGSNLVIASKTYSFMNDTTTLDFITGAETVGIFRTGTIGTAPEPSTLDGTDILW